MYIHLANKILLVLQSAFRNNYSTPTALSNITNDIIRAIEDGHVAKLLSEIK